MKKSNHKLRKQRRKWGTYRVMWHCGGRERFTCRVKKVASRGEATYKQVKLIGKGKNPIGKGERINLQVGKPTLEQGKGCEQRKPTRKGGKLT